MNAQIHLIEKPLALLLMKDRKAERKGRKKNGRQRGKETHRKKQFFLWHLQWVMYY